MAEKHRLLFLTVNYFAAAGRVELSGDRRLQKMFCRYGKILYFPSQTQLEKES